MDSMDVCVARQAILNRHQDVYGYELLFRSNPDADHFDGTDSSSATRQVVAHTLFSAGLEGISGGKRAFINFDRNMLLDGSCTLLSKESVVLEILETVEPDDEVIAACAKLCESGYLIALDDFVQHARFEPMIAKSHILKIDLRATSHRDQERLVRTYGQRGIRMLAEKVETLEEFEWARGIGFDLFQGYFFTKPAIVRGRQIPAAKLSCLRLLQEAQREDIDFDKLRALIKDDVSFSFKLLRFTNSALFPYHAEIHTVEHALMVLGEEGIRRWVAIAALPALASDKPHELIVQSLLRARFSERLAQAAGLAIPASCFTMGLFSMLDVLLDQPIEYAVRQIRLTRLVEETLLGTAPSEERMAIVYSLIRSYEAGEWRTVDRLADALGLTVSSVAEIYVESTRWVSDVGATAG